MKPLDLRAIRQWVQRHPIGFHGIRDGEPVRLDVGELVELVDATVRALLAIEWIRHPESGSGSLSVCPRCMRKFCGWIHDPGCPIDAALTAAGLPDQASRDAERERTAKADIELASKVLQLARMGDKEAQRILEEKGFEWRQPPPVTVPEKP